MLKQTSLVFLFLILFSCSSDSDNPEEEVIVIELPSVTTGSATNTTTNSIEINGNVTNDGGGQVTARGFVWDTSSTPTLDNNKTTNGTGEGAFNATISNLEENSSYFIRAYATNSEGTVYGNEISFTTLEDAPKIFEGDVYLETQEDVENFGNQGFTGITGSLTITGLKYPDVTDLNFLSDLESIGGSLVLEDNYSLENLDGLQNILSLGGDFVLYYNGSTLKEIDGLNGLTEIGGNLKIWNNLDLENLDGLSNLTSLGGGISLRDNNSLVSISGIPGFQEINGDFEIHGNNLQNLDALENLKVVNGTLKLRETEIEDISGLYNLETVGGDFWIMQMYGLTELIGFDKLTSIQGTFHFSNNTNLDKVQGFSNLSYLGGVYLDGGGILSELIGFESLNSIEGDFTYYGYSNLTDMYAFENLSEVRGSLFFRSTGLKNLEFLSNLVYVGGNLEFYNNFGLSTIVLEKLETIMGTLSIWGGSNEFNLDSSWGLKHIGESLYIHDVNSSGVVNGIPGAIGLTNLKAFENLIEVNGDVVIKKNEHLINFCDLQSLLSNGFSGTMDIYENAYNPSQQDIIDGNCNAVP
jgi:hypothetical protein